MKKCPLLLRNYTAYKSFVLFHLSSRYLHTKLILISTIIRFLLQRADSREEHEKTPSPMASLDSVGQLQSLLISTYLYRRLLGYLPTILFIKIYDLLLTAKFYISEAKYEKLLVGKICLLFKLLRYLRVSSKVTYLTLNAQVRYTYVYSW